MPTIVINPKYTGQQTYGRYHKVERLRSVDNPAAANLTREVPSDPDDILAIDDAIDAIVNPAEWQAAQPGASPAAPGPRPDRPPRPAGTISDLDGSRYALRGMPVCQHCGRRMQGNLILRRKADPRVGYRCVYRSEYPGDQTHPRTLFVAEGRVLAVLDNWLAALSAKNLEDTVADMLQRATALDSEPLEIRRARKIASQANNKRRCTQRSRDPTVQTPYRPLRVSRNAAHTEKTGHRPAPRSPADFSEV